MSGRSEPRPAAPDRSAVQPADRPAVSSLDLGSVSPSDLEPVAFPTRSSRLVSVLITLVTVAVAAALGWTMWRAYMDTPWTRDGTVRAYIVAMAAEVAGRIVELPVVDNQFVHRGDLLLVIDPTDYGIGVKLAEASLQQAKADAENAEREATRRGPLASTGAISAEEQQVSDTKAVAARARYHAAEASLAQARVNLERTRIRSPVNGWVTNLHARLGDYATVGRNEIAIVDADSFWVDGYFEETKLHAIQEGDPARVKLMGHHDIVRGHVGSIARGIDVPNAQPNGQGVASVNPIFTWVRLAQRIPVRIEIDAVPDGVRLAAGMTATVEIEPRPRVDPPSSP
jgi:multidrug resistance efflux pump